MKIDKKFRELAKQVEPGSHLVQYPRNGDTIPRENFVARNRIRQAPWMRAPTTDWMRDQNRKRASR